MAHHLPVPKCIQREVAEYLMPSMTSILQHRELVTSDIDYILSVWLDVDRIPPPSELVLFLNCSISAPVLTRQDRAYVHQAIRDTVWDTVPW